MSSVNSVMSDGTEMSERPESPENLILTRKRGRKPFQLRIIKLRPYNQKYIYKLYNDPYDQRTTFSDFQLDFLQKRFEEKRSF